MDINHIKGRKAYNILKDYVGSNPYILSLKTKLVKTPSTILTSTQVEYVTKNYKKEPELINRVIEISDYAGIEIKKSDKLNFIPNKLKIQYLLGETDKAFHVIAQTSSKAKPQMYFLSKNMVYEDFNFELLPVDIEFDRYNARLLERRGWNIMEHQKGDIEFLLSRQGAILANSMGVAKTIPAIIAALHTKAKRVLVVCPASVKIHWEREINIFSENTTIVEGRVWSEARFTIINYDILQNFHTLESKIDPSEPPTYISRELVNANFDIIIVDEAHNLRNKKSIRGEVVYELCRKFGNPKVWLLSGTPVANRPLDYYNLLRLIRCNVAEDYNFYMKRYCEGRMFNKKLANGRVKRIIIANGSSNLDELASRTKHLVRRLLKEDVLDMPEKQVIRMYQKLSEGSRKDYNQVWDVYMEKRRAEKKRGNVERELVELGQLRKFVAMEAIDSTYELAMEAIEQEKKVIIFTTFNEEQELLYEKFGKIAVRHNGSMSINDKQFSVDSFQNNPKIKVFIGNIISAGVGITLTSGDISIFNSYSWVPGDNAQAEDRNWRMGRKNNVTIYYQIFEDTVSETVMNVLDNKTDVINSIVGSEEESRILNERIIDLIVEDE